MKNTNLYRVLRDRQQKEMNEFEGIFFAFSNSQFDEGMRKIGLEPGQVDQIYRLMAGGFIRKDRSAALHEMFDRHEKERDDAMNNPETGDQFICDMFLYELDNHEFGYTGDTEDALDALGFTAEEVVNDKRLNRGICKAVEIIWNRERCNE